MSDIPDQVERTYSWKGAHTGYRFGGTFVPTDRGNRHTQEILQREAEGTLKVIDPSIDRAARVYGEDGVLAGWDTNIGFVPDQENNRLSVIARQAIDQDPSVEQKPGEQIHQAPIKDLIFCLAFERPWPHVKDNTQCQIEYRSGPNSKPHTYQFTLYNVPSRDEVDVASLIFKNYGIDAPEMQLGWLNQAAVLHIEVPIERLCALFRGERKHLQPPLRDFVEDDLELHLTRTRRSTSRGPSRDWLIERAKDYLQRFVMEVGNRIAQAHAFEYGGVPIEYIDKWMTYERMLVVLRTREDTHQLGPFSVQGRKSFELQGPLPPGSSIRRFQNQLPEKSKNLDHLLANIRMLLKMGLHMEGLCLLNGVVEVAIKDQLRFALYAAGAAESTKALERLGHSGRLEIMKSERFLDSLHFDLSFKEGVEKLKDIYKLRNNYLHGLMTPGQEFYLSVHERQNIEDLLEPFVRVVPDNWFSILSSLQRPEVGMGLALTLAKRGCSDRTQ